MLNTDNFTTFLPIFSFQIPSEVPFIILILYIPSEVRISFIILINENNHIATLLCRTFIYAINNI